MKVKTFRAKTMAEALAQVKNEFGSEAVILSTRSISKNKVLGMGGGETVEITAAEDSADVPPATINVSRTGARRDAIAQAGTKAPSSAPSTAPNSIASSSVAPSSASRSPAVPPSAPNPTTPSALPQRSSRWITDSQGVGRRERGFAPRSSDSLLGEVSELKSMVQKLVKQSKAGDVGTLPDDLYAKYQSLVENAVAENLAEKLVLKVRRNLSSSQLVQPDVVQRELGKALASVLPVAEPIEHRVVDGPTVVALVGPTGVGKTTTVAKLAANLSLRDRKRVGLVTLDTYRVAATEQLRTYADIINIPIAVAASPSQLAEAVGSMRDCDIILIDTAGRSQRDADKLEELSRFFETIRPHEIHLVLSSAGGKKVLQEAIRNFSHLGIDRVIFTKLDEAVGFGVLLECLQMADARLSYVTTGQDVPNDIEVARPDRLAALVMTGSLDSGGDRK